MKRISANLYTYIIFWILIAAVLSLSISYPINVVLNQTHDKKMKEEFLSNYKEVADIISQYQNTILDNNLSTTSLNTFDFNELNYKYKINSTKKIIASKNHLNKYKNTDFSNRSMIFPLKFTDGLIYINVTPINELFSYRNLITLLTICLGISIFLIVTYLSLRNILKYIRKIDKGISVIAGGALNYNIPLEGDNELTNLANSINQMSSSLKTQIDKDKETDANQKRLISNISHDLRTPLTTIIGYLNIIEDKKYNSTDELNTYLHVCKKKSLQLEKLINDLFEYTKLSNKDVTINMKKINICTFINQYIISIDKKVVIKNTCSKTPYILADIDLLKRIFDNLFDNIRKYSNPTSDVYISIYEHEDEDDYIIFQISNKTKLNLEDDYKYIFDRMYVADYSRKANSSGLGLSIVSESMKLMQGYAKADYKNNTLSILLKFQRKQD